MKRKGYLPPDTPMVRLHYGGTELLSHAGKEEIPSDVLGSYTGMSEDLTSPVQDADDL